MEHPPMTSPRQFVLGTAGHIDHGKTALIRALTGIDTDRLPQEKERGITIDFGIAHLTLDDGRQIGINDVPGHERFIKNMLAGVAAIDLVLFVIAADDSVMPQTREHLAILELLNIQHGLIALTKTDLVDPDWLELVEDDIRKLTMGTFLENAPIVRTSATTGHGIDQLKKAIAETVDTVQLPTDVGLFRMAIDRSFLLKGLGTIVTGAVWSGTISAGDEVQWMPSGKKLRVRSIQSHEKQIETATHGQRTALNLQSVHHTEIQRGHELAAVDYLKPARRIIVHLKALKNSPFPVRTRSRIRLHLGTQEVIATVRLIQTSKAEPGDECEAVIITAEPIVAVNNQSFVIRAESPLVTLGGGTVLQPTPKRGSKYDLQKLHDLRSDSELTRAAVAIFLRGADPWTNIDLSRETGIPIDHVPTIIESLEKEKHLIPLSLDTRRTVQIHNEVVSDLKKRILEIVSQHHKNSPLESTIPRQRIVTRLHYIDAEIIATLINQLIEESKLTGNEHAVAHHDFAPALSQTQKQWQEQILALYESAAFKPPDLAQLTKATGSDEKSIRPIIDLCVSQGQLVHLTGPFHLHRTWYDQLKHRLIDCFNQQDNAGLTLSQIRELLDTSRKYAVPICEHLDRIGFTKRRGDLRILNR